MQKSGWEKWVYRFLLALVFVLGLVQIQKNFIDFPIYHKAALKIWNHDIAAFYERDRLVPNGNYYPYFWAFLFVPLALLPISVAKFVFMLLFYAAYFFLVSFSARLALPDAPEKQRRLQIFLILPTLFLVNDAFMNSNIGVLLAALLVLAYEYRNSRAMLSSVMLALPAVIKIYPAFMFGFFGWERRWKILCAGLALLPILYFGAPMMVEGFDEALRLTKDHVYVVSHYDRQIGWSYDNRVFQNFPGSLMRVTGFLGGDVQQAYRWGMVTALLLVVLFYFKTFLKNASGLNDERSRRYFALTMALIPMLTPVSWFNMALFYLPLMAFVFRRALFEGHVRSRVFVVIFILFYCLTTRDLVGRELNQLLLQASVPFLGLLALVSSFVWDLRESE